MELQKQGISGTVGKSRIEAGVADPQGLNGAVFTGLEAAEQVWRQLENDAVLTPYQRFDWIKHLTQSRKAADYFVICLRKGEEPVALLPLSVDRHLGLRRGRLIGSEVGNSDWVVTSRSLGAPLAKHHLATLWATARSEPCRIDFLELRNQPKTWMGHANPFLELACQPGPDHLYRGEVFPDPAARIDAKRHRNLRRGRRRLEESWGPVRLLRAKSPAEVARVHAAFLAQRETRFEQMGISNPFARKDLLDFFHTAGESSLGQDRPVMAFHALMAGDEILATSVGSFCGPHFSQYINSTADGEAARYSLMGILMLELLQELWHSGVRTIDLGLGDFDYKLDWAEKEEVYDSFIPLSWPARLLVPTLATIREGKRRIKQDEKLWATARRIRAIAHRTASVGTSIPVSRVLREKA